MTEVLDTIEHPQEMGDALVLRFPETGVGSFHSGSHLVVGEGESAVFVQAGQVLAAFGPGRYSLTADNLPGLDEAEGAFDIVVYFVNTGAQTIKWGTRAPLPVGSSGETVRGFGQATIWVADARQFVAQVVVGQEAAQLAEVQNRVREAVQQALGEILAELEGPASGLGKQLEEVATKVQAKLQPRFEGLGLALEALTIKDLVAPDSEPVARPQEDGGPLSFLLNREAWPPPYVVAQMMKKQNIKRALQELGLTVVETGMEEGVRYGISAATLIVEDGRLLLVRHQEPGKFDFWTPPGGGLQGEESIFDCARREMHEETGLDVELDRILYIQEFLEPGYHFCKFFILARAFSGTLTLANREPGEEFVREARFFSREELADLTVHPEILKTEFWQDREAQPPPTRYLGLQWIGGES